MNTALYIFAAFGAVGFVLLVVVILAALTSKRAIHAAFDIADDTPTRLPRTGGSDADKVDAAIHREIRP